MYGVKSQAVVILRIERGSEGLWDLIMFRNLGPVPCRLFTLKIHGALQLGGVHVSLCTLYVKEKFTSKERVLVGFI